MNCRCGHPERAHVGGGRCSVPDCPCERFEPGDTLRAPSFGERFSGIATFSRDTPMRGGVSVAAPARTINSRSSDPGNRLVLQLGGTVWTHQDRQGVKP
jgi:hypothetical protein